MTTPASGEQKVGPKVVIEVALAIVAVMTLILGLVQYQRAQRWEKSELAARELNRMTSEPLLQLGLQVIDWPRRRLVLPPDYAVLARDSGFFRHSWSRLDTALTKASGLVRDSAFGSVEMVMYVDAVERLLTYLEQVEHYLRIGLLEPEDVRPVRYWVDRTLRHESVRTYMELWDYRLVDSLSARLRTMP